MKDSEQYTDEQIINGSMTRLHKIMEPCHKDWFDC